MAGAKIELLARNEAYLESTPQIAMVLNLTAGDQVFKIRRVRAYEGRPLVVFEAIFPESIGKEVQRLDLHDALFVPALRASLDPLIHEQYQQIEAVAATRELAKQLRIGEGEPILLVQRVFVDSCARPVVLFKSFFRADLYFHTVSFPTLRKTLPSDQHSDLRRLGATPENLQATPGKRKEAKSISVK